MTTKLKVLKKNMLQQNIRFTALCLGFVFCLGAHAQTLSVALSDNLVVLTDQQRTKMLELVNISDDLLEYQITVDEKANGKLADGVDIIRWAPAKASVQPRRTGAMRVSSRLTADMPPGEYVFRTFVKAALVDNVKRTPLKEAVGDEPVDNAMSLSVGVTPVLPITVYLRHKIPPNMLEVSAFVSTPDDKDYLGYFPVAKSELLQSFVGRVQVLEKSTNKVINEGRLHLSPTSTDISQVRVTRQGRLNTNADAFCMRVWDTFPGVGPPRKDFCQ